MIWIWIAVYLFFSFTFTTAIATSAGKQLQEPIERWKYFCYGAFWPFFVLFLWFTRLIEE